MEMVYLYYMSRLRYTILVGNPQYYVYVQSKFMKFTLPGIKAVIVSQILYKKKLQLILMAWQRFVQQPGYGAPPGYPQAGPPGGYGAPGAGPGYPGAPPPAGYSGAPAPGSYGAPPAGYPGGPPPGEKWKKKDDWGSLVLTSMICANKFGTVEFAFTLCKDAKFFACNLSFHSSLTADI